MNVQQWEKPHLQISTTQVVVKCMGQTTARVRLQACEEQGVQVGQVRL